jgi:hypothetical protein
MTLTKDTPVGWKWRRRNLAAPKAGQPVFTHRVDSADGAMMLNGDHETAPQTKASPLVNHR